MKPAVLYLALVLSVAGSAGPAVANQADAGADDHRWRKPDRLRAVLGLAAIIGGGGAWYWIDRERQVADWDFPSWRERFTREAYINDNNPFAMNYVWHTLGGTYFHLAGRTNDLGLIESTLFGLGASLAWEYGIEFREKISLNDIIFTTGAGIAAGEFLHWLGRYLQDRELGTRGKVARWSIGVMQSSMDRLDGHAGPRGPKISHRFRVSSSYTRANAEQVNGVETSGDSNLFNLRFHGELAALSDYLEPGVRRSRFRDGNITSLDVQLTADGGGLPGRRFLADTMMFGWRHEQVPVDGEDGLALGLTIGSAIAVRYQDENYDAWRDRLGALHMPGLGIDTIVIGDGWSLRALVRGHFDYAGVHAMTYPRWAAAYPDEVGKSILARQGYNYAWGASGRIAAELRVSHFAFGVGAFHGRYWSQQGFDRQQSLLTVDQVGRARYSDRTAWLRGALTDSVFVEIRRDRHNRSSELEEFDGTNDLRRRTIEIGAYF